MSKSVVQGSAGRGGGAAEYVLRWCMNDREAIVYQALVNELAGKRIPLPDTAHALAFTRAAEELELMLDDTTAIVVSVSEYVPGEPPPPGSETPGGPWLLAGLVLGPPRDDVKDPKAWLAECREILAGCGLVEEAEEMVS